MFQTNNQILSRKMMIFPNQTVVLRDDFPLFLPREYHQRLCDSELGKKTLQIVDISQPTWTCIPVSKWFIIHIYIYIIHIYIYIYTHISVYIYTPFIPIYKWGYAVYNWGTTGGRTHFRSEMHPKQRWGTLRRYSQCLMPLVRI